MSLAERCIRLRPKHRRVIALLLVPVVLSSAWALLYLPIVSLQESQTSWREDAFELLSRTAASEALHAKLDQDLSAMRASPVWGKFYESADGGSSSSALQAEVSSLLANVSAPAQSIAPIASTPMPYFTRVGLRLSTSMRIDQLKSFLNAVAAHPRYLRIEQLSVSAPQMQVSDENPPLAVTMEVHGFEISRASRSAVGAPSKLALSESTS